MLKQLPLMVRLIVQCWWSPPSLRATAKYYRGFLAVRRRAASEHALPMSEASVARR